MTYITGQGLYSLDAEGVKKVDFDSQEVELVVDFNECNINRFDIPYMRIYSVSDDEVLLAGFPKVFCPEIYDALITVFRCSTFAFLFVKSPSIVLG